MITRKNILDLETRRKIYNFIKENPGVHLREISRRIDIPITTLNYHINYLKKIELVSEKKDLRFKRTYIREQVGLKEKRILELVRKEKPLKILIYLSITSACSQIELSRELEISPQSVSYYLKKMESEAIIERAPFKNGFIVPFENAKNPDNQDCVILRNPIKSEKFFRWKDEETYELAYKVLIKYRDSISKKKIIDSYLNYLKNIFSYIEYMKKSNIKRTKKFWSLESGFDNFLDFISNNFLKPPFSV